MIWLAAAFLAVLAASPAEAQCLGFQCPPRLSRTVPVGYGLDSTGTITRAYGFRRLLTSYSTNKLIRLVRASDSTQSDIGFLAGGALDVATATTFCAATTCKVVTMYDQSGNAGDWTQGTDANRPAYTANCLGTSPCATFTAGSQTLVAAANVTPATGVASFSVVANRSVGTGACAWLRENAGNNRLGARAATANQLTLTGGSSGTVNAAATDAAWHAIQAVLNGTSSVVGVDGTETTGTATGNTTAGVPGVVGAGSTTCNLVEAVVWDNVSLSAGVRGILNANQHAWWGF